MERIRLEHIAFDAGTQIREAISEQVVTDYAERMADGVEFPPVVLFADGCCRTDGSVIYYLADGFHRVQASARNQFVDIPAEIHAGTKDDALWFALGANKANGHQMTANDKRHAVNMAIRVWPERSSAVIAEQVGCSKAWVATIKSVVSTALHLPERVVGVDGKSYAASPKARATARERAREMLAGGASAEAVQKETGVGKEMVSELRRSLGLSMDKTKAGVQQRREAMRRMAGDGYTSRQIAAALGLSEEGCRAALRDHGIAVPADAAVRGTQRHDSTRIVEHIVMDAENLTADVHLIDFSALDRAQIADWLDSLTQSRVKLGAFIKRLTQEQKQHGEAA